MENLSRDLHHKLPRSPTSSRICVHRDRRVRGVGLLGFFEKTRSLPLQLKMIEFLRFSSLLFAQGRQIQRQFLLSGRRGGGRWHQGGLTTDGRDRGQRAGLRRGGGCGGAGPIWRLEEAEVTCGGGHRGLAIMLLTRTGHLLEYLVVLDLLDKVLLVLLLSLLGLRGRDSVEHEPAAILTELGELVLDGRPLRPLLDPPRLEVARPLLRLVLALHQPPRSDSVPAT